MVNVLRKACRVYVDEGSHTLIRKGLQFGYDNYVRPLLPQRVVSYNGVLVRASHLGDALIPWQNTDVSEYEDTIIQGIRQHTRKGDTIVIVGGGWGVSSVVAAEQVGDSGKVITFEGSRDAVEKVKETADLNGVADRISVRHAVVSQAISLRGEKDSAQVIPPEELPNCNLLSLDCEGAEMSILEEMSIRPGNVIVETHGMYGSPKTSVESQLEEIRYEVLSKDIAEPRIREFCEQNGIYVLTTKHHDK